MADPITEANELVDRLEREVVQLRTYLKAAGDAEVAYRNARADAFDAAKGTVEGRRYQTDKATAEASRKRHHTAADVVYQQELLKAIHKKIDVKRSEIATDRSLSGVGT